MYNCNRLYILGYILGYILLHAIDNIVDTRTDDNVKIFKKRVLYRKLYYNIGLVILKFIQQKNNGNTYMR